MSTVRTAIKLKRIDNRSRYCTFGYIRNFENKHKYLYIPLALINICLLYYAEYDKELSTGSDNGSTLTVSPVPDSAYNVELNYLHKPQSLTSATTGTWLSTNARNALLYASLVEAYTFLKGEPELIGQYEKRFMEELSRLKNRAEGRSRRDEYRADSLRTNVT